jgi:glycerophosphoryl diester phosphodiesterase
MSSRFDLQGHRGARGLKPENTLPSFERALDLGVTSVETDLHLTREGVPILFHDPAVSSRLCRLAPGSQSPDPAGGPPVRTLSLEQLRGYLADRNPDPARFPEQESGGSPLAQWFAESRGFLAYAPPTLEDLFAFAAAYAGEPGAATGKSASQRAQASRVRFDLELKRVPFRPDLIGDAFDGTAPGLLEKRVLEIIAAAGMVERTMVRSFDHRSVRWLRRLEPRLTAAVLVAGTAPVAPENLARQADAQVYSPEAEFLDALQVRQLHTAGLRVVPWTVNQASDWDRLIDWGVDGLTTDFPDRLAAFLRQRGILF